jgi:hypothetical protein
MEIYEFFCDILSYIRTANDRIISLDWPTVFEMARIRGIVITKSDLHKLQHLEYVMLREVNKDGNRT